MENKNPGVQARINKRALLNNRYTDEQRREMSKKLLNMWQKNLISKKGFSEYLKINRRTFDNRLVSCSWLDSELDKISEIGFTF